MLLKKEKKSLKKDPPLHMISRIFLKSVSFVFISLVCQVIPCLTMSFSDNLLQRLKELIISYAMLE